MPYQRSPFEILSDILAADSQSWGIVITLVIFAVVSMRALLPVKSLATVYAPALLFGGLAGIHLLRITQVQFLRHEASNIVVSATIGLIVMSLILIVLTRLIYALSSVSAPETTAADVERLARQRHTGIKMAPPAE